MFGLDDVIGGFTGGGIADWLGTIFDTASPYAATAVDAAGQVPWGQVLGLAGQAAPLAMSLFSDQGGQQQGTSMPQMPDFSMQSPSMQSPGMQAQMQQGVTPQQMRRRLADAQSQGLSGASPDFLASMAGVTPQELTQMMGYGQR